MTDKEKQLMLDNIKLVPYVLKSIGYYPSFDKKYEREYEDYYQQGMLALAIACTRFDETKGYQFATFAIPYISGIIRRYRNECDCRIRYSRNLTISAYQLRKELNELELSEDSFNDLSTVIDILGIDCSVIDAYNILHSVDSLDRQIVSDKDNGSVSLSELIGDLDYNYEYCEYIEIISNLVDYLTENASNQRHLDIFVEYLYSIVYDGVKLKQSQIANKYNLSQSYVARIIKNYIELSKNYLINSGILMEDDFK